MPQIKVRGVAILENKLLLCQLDSQGFFCLPGGTLESGETTKETLHRELIEELGVAPIIGDHLYTQEFIKRGDTIIDFWYAITNPADYQDVDLSTTSHGAELTTVGYYDIAALPNNTKPDFLADFLMQHNN